MALEDAAQIIFLIDGRTEITGIDRDLAKMLRKIGKPVTLAVNKIDSPRRDDLLHEFHSLGFEDVFAVSAEHKLGVAELLDHVTSEFPKTEKDAEKMRSPSRAKRAGAEEAAPASEKQPFVHPSIKVAIIGRPNVGKSTLVKLLRRQFEPQGGRILIDDRDIALITWNSLNEAIAEVPQVANVFRESSIRCRPVVGAMAFTWTRTFRDPASSA